MPEQISIAPTYDMRRLRMQTTTISVKVLTDGLWLLTM